MCAHAVGLLAQLMLLYSANYTSLQLLRDQLPTALPYDLVFHLYAVYLCVFGYMDCGGKLIKSL